MMRYMKYSAIGIEMGMSVAAGALIGYFLDVYFGTEPWLLLFWLLCGIGAGFRSLIRLSRKFLQESKENENQGSD